MNTKEKGLILAYLTNLGYTNVRFQEGREGYFILAQNYNCTMCIEIEPLLEEMRRKGLY